MYFISLSCLIALAKTSSIVLNRSAESGHSLLVSDIREKVFSLVVQCRNVGIKEIKSVDRPMELGKHPRSEYTHPNYGDPSGQGTHGNVEDIAGHCRYAWKIKEASWIRMKIKKKIAQGRHLRTREKHMDS